MSECDGVNAAFILSMPRSGSTLLSLMLGSHPEICCPPEPWIILTLAEYLDIGDIRAAPYGRQWAEVATLEFFLSAERRRRGACGEVLSKLLPNFSADPYAIAQQLAAAFYQMHLKITGRHLFVDKTPRYYAALELLDALFPQQKKIVLLRNPLDVFASYKSTWEITKQIFQPEGVLVHTRDFCEGLFRLSDYAERNLKTVLTVRYEELVADPELVLREVCQFLGIEFSLSMLDYPNNISLLDEYRKSPVGDQISPTHPRPATDKNVNAWASRLDLEDIKALVEVTGLQIFDRLGYQDVRLALRNLGLSDPDEAAAASIRASLLEAARKQIQEPPFSTWSDFVYPLRQSQADRADRLKALNYSQTENQKLNESLEASEADRAARLEALHQQQAALDALGLRYTTLEQDRNQKSTLIDQLQILNDGLKDSLHESEVDRAARLDVIVRQQQVIVDLQKKIEASEADRAAKADAIAQQRSDIGALMGRLESSEADRAVRLESILAQQALIQTLQKDLEISELDREARLQSILQQQLDLDRLGKSVENLAIEKQAQADLIENQWLSIKTLTARLSDADAQIAQAVETVAIQADQLTKLRTYAGFASYKLNKFKIWMKNLVKNK